MLIALLLAAQIQAPLRSEPVRLVREIQADIDRTGGQALERVWRATLARQPREPRALLAVATFERNRYRYEQADSLLGLVAARGAVGADWRAMSLVGRAAWRSLGSDVQVADSLLVQARELSRSAGARDVEGEVVLILMQVRGRTQGARVGRQLLDEWWSLLDRPVPLDSVLRTCQRVPLDDQLGQPADPNDIHAGALVAERLESWRLAGNCRLAQAQILDRRGYGDNARWAANQALQHFRRIDYAPGVALASQWYGYLNVLGTRYAAGKALLEEAIRAAQRTRFDAVEGWAYSGLAQLYVDVGDHALARHYATRASESHRRRGDLWGLANARRFEAAALEARGELAEAAAMFEVARGDYIRARSPALAVQSVVSRINLLIRLGAVDSAERTLVSSDSAFQTSAAWRQVEAPVLRGMVALKRGRLDEAAAQFLSSVQAMQWRRDTVRASSVAVAAREALVALQTGRLALADSALRAVMDRLARARGSSLVGTSFAASLAQAAPPWGGAIELYPALVDQLVARGQLPQALELIERARARDVVERRLRRVALIEDTSQVARVLRSGSTRSALVTLQELRETLAPDEAFVTYVLGIDEAPTTAIVVTRESARAYRLPRGAALLPDIERFVQLAAAGSEGVAGRRLGDGLVAPILADLPASVTRLLISPDGELHRIPFDALRLPDGRLLLERATVSISPSATALLALRATSSGSGEQLVALGDPRYPAAARGVADSANGRAGFARATLPRLRFSGTEARRVATYGRRPSLLVGAAATERALRHALESAGVVHVAAHGLVDDASQFNTALAVTPGASDDGFLTPAEISQMQLNGPLVVLSSCRSSGGKVLAGEGLRGLTAPLLEAGARAVVGTHWSIGDRSVVPFIDRFYQAMSTGARPDDALRTAKLAAIRAGVSIADWGSFTITGDAAAPVSLKRPSASPLPWGRGAAGR